MDFQKYQHIERYGNDEVEGINLGTCHVFPKLDGTNGSIWYDQSTDTVRCGSRRRELIPFETEDNHGFMEHVRHDERYERFFNEIADWRLFGEWLVPHSLKTYRDNAWRKFYVFDVLYYDPITDETDYLPYDEYIEIFDEYDIHYIPRLAKIQDGTEEDFKKIMLQNTFLIQETKGLGEGIVIKNYDFINKYGRATWAKMVTNEFKEKNRKEMGEPEIIRESLERQIVAKFLTEEMIEKTRTRIEISNKGWSNRLIPQLLSMVYHDFINEETWQFVKEHKNPTINFRSLQGLVTQKIKDTLPTYF